MCNMVVHCSVEALKVAFSRETFVHLLYSNSSNDQVQFFEPRNSSISGSPKHAGGTQVNVVESKRQPAARASEVELPQLNWN